MNINDIKLGKRVKSVSELSGVPKGTEGVIISDYGSGFMVAWDREENPYPQDMSPTEVANMFAVNPECPLRDGFDKSTEMHMLEVV